MELQDSAYPYHDWNDRITAECYEPNASSRILNPEKKIIDIINNYSKISFNFGPTLLSWMETHAPEVYRAILEADRESQRHFSGHGSALAQIYNHIIMPLANTRDKYTQVIWGIKDFETRFSRRPEGMWLPETAVDLETLKILVDNGIKFTILAPHQARRVRKIDSGDWMPLQEAGIDPRRPYLLNLPGGKNIAIFFYDRIISHEVGFGELLKNGEHFARRLIAAFDPADASPQLVHIATDGETYGHHHQFGDMALAYCLYYLESNNLARRTIYGEYLEKNPPAYEVEISENTSWSCVHGVERWRSNCGCNSGIHKGWQQEWRGSLRVAMDWLRDNLIPIYEERMAELVKDPWNARDDYIKIVLDRAVENVDRFLADHARKELSREEITMVLKLLEMQRHALLMYTSCGWFFDDISGIEAVQVMLYAARAMQLAREISNVSLEETYVSLLERGPGNLSDLRNGAVVYERFVKSAAVDLLRVGVHYAVTSLFEDYRNTVKIYSYTCTSGFYDRIEAGMQKLALGEVRVYSDITREDEKVSFAVLHIGNHNVIGGAHYAGEKDDFSNPMRDIKEAFTRSDISEVVRLIDKYFAAHSYSLWHIFKDEQRKILSQIFDQASKDIEGSFRKIYESYYPSMQLATDMKMPLPGIFFSIAAFVCNLDIRTILQDEKLDLEKLSKIVEDINKWHVELDRTTLGFIASQKISFIMDKFVNSSEDISLLKEAVSILKGVGILSLDLNLWKAQNMYFSIARKRSVGASKEWLENFKILGEYLGVRI